MDNNKISAIIRFEIFKRDRFTCKHCYNQTPNVLLYIDTKSSCNIYGPHRISDLHTVCHHCYQSKYTSVHSNSLYPYNFYPYINERNEFKHQINAMYEWKTSEEEISEYSANILVEHLKKIIKPHILDDSESKNILGLLYEFNLDMILSAIRKSKKSYLKYDDGGIPTLESKKDFLDKISGILYNSKKDPVSKKVSHIKSCCAKHIPDYDVKKVTQILNFYVLSLRENGWTEKNIEKELKDRILPIALSVSSLYEWIDSTRKLMSHNCYINDDMLLFSTTDSSIIYEKACRTYESFRRFYLALKLISFISTFEKKESLIKNYTEGIFKYMCDQCDILLSDTEQINPKIYDLKPSLQILYDYNISPLMKISSENSNMKNVYHNFIETNICHYLNAFYLPQIGIIRPDDISSFMEYLYNLIPAKTA